MLSLKSPSHSVALEVAPGSPFELYLFMLMFNFINAHSLVRMKQRNGTLSPIARVAQILCRPPHARAPSVSNTTVFFLYVRFPSDHLCRYLGPTSLCCFGGDGAFAI